jgi:hypothetical protein
MNLRSIDLQPLLQMVSDNNTNKKIKIEETLITEAKANYRNMEEKEKRIHSISLR